MRWLTAACLLVALPAPAWDGDEYWERQNNDNIGGSGGIWATGARRDHGITCAHCHINDANQQGRVGLTPSFSPPLGAGGKYTPGTRYTVTMTMTGEWLGLSGCGAYVTHTNGFGAAFELSTGASAGLLESDSGQSAANCLQTSQSDGGTTLTYGRCTAVVSKAALARTNWTFFWTAPAAGAGAVTLYWGVVDGNCDMMSMGDDVKTGKQTLPEGP
jgi:hypothetical protein